MLGLIGGAALPPVQVGLIVLARLVLHRLALQLVPAKTANWIAYGFFGGNALIGPTLGNFTDLCQLPLAVFALMLGLQRRMGWLILSAAVLILPVRVATCFSGGNLSGGAGQATDLRPSHVSGLMNGDQPLSPARLEQQPPPKRNRTCDYI